MKNLYFVFINFLFPLALLAQSIPPRYFAFNGWMTDLIGTSTSPGNSIIDAGCYPDGIEWNPNGKFYQILAGTNPPNLVQNLNVKLWRYAASPMILIFQPLLSAASSLKKRGI